MRIHSIVLAAAVFAGSALAQTPDKDFAALKEYAAKIDEMRQARSSEPAQQAEFRKLVNELSEKVEAFAEKHLSGEITPALAKVVVEADQLPALRSIADKAIEHRFENGQAADVVPFCDSLAKAGISNETQKRFAGAKTIALFAAGKDDEALNLAKQSAEEAGKEGLKPLDIAAAILAARGAYDEARALFDAYADAHGGDESTAYRYESKRTLLGKPAPEIGIQKWVGPKGTDHEGLGNLAALKGKVVVLDFWQTWCGPCRAVMPGLSRAQERLQSQGVQILGLCRKDGKNGFDWAKQAGVPKEEIEGDKYPAHVVKFSADMGLSYVCGIADTDANNKAYSVKGIPTLVIVDGDSNVAWLTIGGGLGFDALIETLCQRLAKRAAGSR